MPRLELTRDAVADLQEIGRYTKRQWGKEQARRYRDELDLALKKLSLSPRLGTTREDVGKNVRSFQVGSHIAYYFASNNGITILRLLHPSRDVDRAFGRGQDKSQEQE